MSDAQNLINDVTRAVTKADLALANTADLQRQVGQLVASDSMTREKLDQLNKMIFGDGRTANTPHIRRDIDQLIQAVGSLKDSIRELNERMDDGVADNQAIRKLIAQMQVQIDTIQSEIEKAARVATYVGHTRSVLVNIVKSEWFLPTLLKLLPFGAVLGGLVYEILKAVLGVK